MRIVETDEEANRQVEFPTLAVGQIFWFDEVYYRKDAGDAAHRMDNGLRCHFSGGAIVTRIPDEDVELHILGPKGGE